MWVSETLKAPLFLREEGSEERVTDTEGEHLLYAVSEGRDWEEDGRGVFLPTQVIHLDCIVDSCTCQTGCICV